MNHFVQRDWPDRPPAIKGRFYRKSLLIVLSITCLPTAIIGITLYLLGSSHIGKEVTSSNEALLLNAVKRINGDLNQLELTATQWAFDPRFDGSLRNVDLKDQYTVTQNLYRTLTVMKGFYPLVDQVHLFVDGKSPVVVSDFDGIEAVSSPDDLAGYRAVMSSKQGAFWLNGFPRVNRSDDHTVALVHKVPGIGQPYGTLIFYLDRDKLVSLVHELSLGKAGSSFIIDEKGRFVVTEKGAGLPEGTPFETALAAEIKRRETGSGTFLYNFQGETYTVTFGDFTRLGLHWTYVTAASLSSMTAPVKMMSRMIVGVSLFGFVVALLLSWLASKRIYHPIHRLVGLFHDERRAPDPPSDEIGFLEKQWRHLNRESRELREKLEQAQPWMRSSFLLHLIQGHYYSFTEEELRERMNAYGWSMDGKRFLLVLLQVTGLSRLQGRFTDGDAQLVSFAAANIAQELTAARGEQADIVNFQDLSVGILLSFGREEPEEAARGSAFQLAASLAETICAVLKVQSTILIGRPLPRIADLPESLRHLRQAARYRDVQEETQILSLEDLLPSMGREAVPYPFGAEKEVKQAIRMGLPEEAAAAVQSFVEILVQEGGKEMFVQDGALQLLGSIQHAILEAGYQPRGLYGDDDLYAELRGMRDPERMTEWFRVRVIGPYGKALACDKALHQRRLVERAMEYVKENYDSDVSLERCAEDLGTSPFTLSKAFKHIADINFIDYLIQLRIEKAKELLDDTDMKVGEIALQIGYQPSYLNRLFKKLVGVTPGQYRERKANLE
ncbi:helix-turn-helix domain-containing protein [Paenibacillus cellulositrophicus]|uniref:helix-turn-helix domain-containing protein n=1 Tax=Paenibacillus cellulositrophicus TaxID=562959 RepID=UPI003D983955